jgi:endonuclease/exonuclease/phosphatase (EEP) superfamily protein YafD
MGILALTQAVGFGLIGPLPVIQSLTPWLLLPAFPIAVVAAWRKRRALALTAAGVAVALLVLSAPIAFPGGRPDVPADAPRFSVAFANVYHHNESAAAGEAVLAPDADVLAVVELNEAMNEQLQQLGVDERYPYRVARPHWSSEGLAVYSRFPIVSEEIRRIGSRLGLEAVLDVDGQHVRIVVVHPFPPVSDGRTSREWADSVDAIGDAATSPGPPTFVVGDFNASRWHPPFRHLLGRGLRDVHEWMGKGFSTSWPVAWDLPPFVRLDHALVRPGVVPTEVSELTVPGSDHRGFVAELAVTEGST